MHVTKVSFAVLEALASISLALPLESKSLVAYVSILVNS